eukprot:6180484-Pleurochrysis_carterae.AAC.2
MRARTCQCPNRCALARECTRAHMRSHERTRSHPFAHSHATRTSPSTHAKKARVHAQGVGLSSDLSAHAGRAHKPSHASDACLTRFACRLFGTKVREDAAAAAADISDPTLLEWYPELRRLVTIKKTATEAAVSEGNAVDGALTRQQLQPTGLPAAPHAQAADVNALGSGGGGGGGFESAGGGGGGGALELFGVGWRAIRVRHRVSGGEGLLYELQMARSDGLEVRSRARAAFPGDCTPFLAPPYTLSSLHRSDWDMWVEVEKFAGNL